MDTYNSIKLLKSKGHSIKKIARLLKISKNTVRKYIRDPDPPYYRIGSNPGITGFKESTESIIEPGKSQWEIYRDDIIGMYYDKKYIGSRIFEELKRKGAEGSRTSFYVYYARVRDTDVAKRARERYETGPGKQSQFDWSEYTVRIGDRIRKIYIFLTILCYSRYRYGVGSLDISQASIFEAKELAWKYFGGTPEEDLTDNARQMVDNANRRVFRWNRKYEEFMAHYGIKPRACKVRHAWTKGKVENPFKYLEEHFIKGNEFTSLEDFNDKLIKFCDEVNRRNHAGINAIPYEKYLEERDYLNPLPDITYVDVKEEWRKVSNDCLLSYEGNKYSVPYQYAFKHVWVRKSLGNKVVIYSQRGNIIAEHIIPSKKGLPVTDLAHFLGLSHTKTNSAQSVRNEFLTKFKDYEIFLEKISAVNRFNWKYDIIRILDLNNIYKLEDINSAIESSIEHNVYSYNFIYAYITSRFDIEYKDHGNEYLTKDVVMTDDIRRDLVEYENIITI